MECGVTNLTGQPGSPLPPSQAYNDSLGNVSYLAMFNESFGAGGRSTIQPGHSMASNGPDSEGMEMFSTFLKAILVPIICVFGILGNILTLLVLTRKRLKVTCDGTERTVHIGLAALAVSDLLFCLCLLPHGFYRGNKFDYPSKSFELIYKTYSSAFINTFILTSTWLTVIMATSRYLAICHPFKARHLIGITGTKASVSIVYIMALLFNIPRLFEQEINTLCINNRIVYFNFEGPLGDAVPDNRPHTIYIWSYFTMGIFLPLMLLAFCNICLVRALRESSRIRRRYRVPAAHVDSNHRITSILVTIVIMYILLVSPAEILLFIQDRLIAAHTESWKSLQMAIDLTNVLQTINFSCNFVLYFVLNVHFRHGLRDLLICVCALCPLSRCAKPKRHKELRLHRQISLKTTQTTV